MDMVEGLVSEQKPDLLVSRLFATFDSSSNPNLDFIEILGDDVIDSNLLQERLLSEFSQKIAGWD